ncbi:tetratricopeptide repeat protein [Desulforhopalus sp. 52FAK]
MEDNTKKRFTQKKICSFAVLLFMGLFLYGCGGRPAVPVYHPSDQRDYPESTTEDVQVTPTPPETDVLVGPAAPLHKKAQGLLAQKEYRQAELAMERALRIEPKNGYYWHTLAEIAYSQHQLGKTVQLCLKSKSLARGDSRLIQLNDRLIAKSK